MIRFDFEQIPAGFGLNGFSGFGRIAAVRIISDQYFLLFCSVHHVVSLSRLRDGFICEKSQKR